MNMNFQFYNPTEILFGKGQIQKIAQKIPKDRRILLTYGGGSIQRNGIYEQVTQALSEHTIALEQGGIEVNPDYSTLMKIVVAAREAKCDFIVAVGGGSVIDGAKFLSAAIPCTEFDPWLLVSEHRSVHRTIEFGAVLTLAATGSEMNSGSVISRRETGEKRAFGSRNLFPQFSVLDPSALRTLDVRQRRNGVVDAFIHILEQYATYPTGARVQDEWAEGLIRILIELGADFASPNPSDEALEQIMWTASMALNGLIGAGVPNDWATHMIGHEITALYGLDHAQTLACVYPGVLRVQQKDKEAKLAQLAHKCLLPPAEAATMSTEELAQAAQTKIIEFFESLGVITELYRYKQVPENAVEELLARCTSHGLEGLGEHKNIHAPEIAQILSIAMKNPTRSESPLH